MEDKDYEQKKRECWEEFKRTNLDGEVQWQPVSRYDVFCAAFDRAFALGKQEKDADGEVMLTVPRKNDSEILHVESVKETRIADEETHLRNLSQETANCDKEFDNILKDSFSKDRRLNIASMILSGLLASGKDKHPVKRALELTDSLIAEGRKGYRPKSPIN